MRVYIVFSDHGLAGAFSNYNVATRFADELAKQSSHKIVYLVQGLEVREYPAPGEEAVALEAWEKATRLK